MADGGTGTLDVLLSAGQGDEIRTPARDALGRVRTVRYGCLAGPEGAAAVIEVAEIVGLHQAPGHVLERTTAGVGDVLRDALDRGLRRFQIGLGGTSTNDGGAGFLEALGARFLGPGGRPLRPSPSALLEMEALDLRLLDPRLRQCSITVLVDVANPLCGPDGATLTYGPQKGVPPHQLGLYDALLARLAGYYAEETGRDCAQPFGSGAAGGMGAALVALGASLESGAHRIARSVGLDAMLTGAALLLTGEGRTDRQTLKGKVPWVVAGMARDAGVAGALISGQIAPDVRPALGERFVAFCDLADPPEDALMAHHDPLLRLAEKARALMDARLREGNRD